MDNEQVILEVDPGVQAKAEPAAADRVKEDVRLFSRMFPGVKKEDIPQEVWGMVDRGQSLVESWHAFQTRRQENENRALRSRLDAAEKNRSNREASLPSQQTSGASSTPDRFVQALLSDD